MKDYKILADEILNEIGGMENISNVTHCMTRLRFTLKNEENIYDDKVKKIDGVIGVARSGGQYQVIIGQDVPKVYEKIKNNKVSVSEDTENKEKEKFEFKNLGNIILNYLSGSLTPIIPILISASMIKTIIAIFGPTLLNWILEGSDLYILLNFVGDAGFYFLPIIVGYSASKKLGSSPVLGMFVGAILLHPTLVQMAAEGTKFTVYGIPTLVNNYSSSIVPILLSIPVLKVIEKFLTKHIPVSLSTIFVPTLTILIMLPLSLSIFGPLGAYIGDFIGVALLKFGEFGGFIATAVIAMLWSFLVISGMHIVLVVTMITMIIETGSEGMIAPAASAATWAGMGMALGAFLRIKDKKEKALTFGYFISSFLGGVGEPYLYGLGFKYKRPFIGLLAGAAAGGLFAGLFKVRVYVLGASNFLSLLTFASDLNPSNLPLGIISCLIAMVIAAIVTYFTGFTKEDLGI
ncbi:MAG: PTS transporter subunit EIIC [Erysipelotrichaceae bacterium]|nr:PTS transporter subunit EIIC [Erysipelotrichaceae bacterium]